ncbi:MAG: IS21 family transposase [Propionibacteriaceae bacterium]
MFDIEFIRKKHYLEGWPIRKISRQLNVSRQSVRKALASSDPPRYRLIKPRANPVMDPYRPIIESWLAEDEKAPAKQRHTARRIFVRLQDEYQFKGGESTVRRFVASITGKQREVFIPLEAGYGQQAQVDWGQALVQIDGASIVAHLFCLRMRASGVPFAWAAPTEKLESFLEGHRRAFEYLGGVPRECLYDNPKTAVARILSGPERLEHTVFSSLRAHYLFESLFCRPAQGHEKGSVENLVGYVRRNALVPVPSFPSWEALNAHLLAWCEAERDRRKEGWEKESLALRPMPKAPFRCALTQLLSVNTLSLITLDRNRYSVPCRYAGLTLRVLVYTDRIEAWDGEEQVAVHGRCYLRGQTILELAHYLPALATKPHAASHAAFVPQMDPIYAQVRDQLCRARRDGYRDFAAILLLHQEFPAHSVLSALKEAIERSCLAPQAVRQILLNQAMPSEVPSVKVPISLAQARLSPPDLSRYDLLMKEASA